MSICAKADLNNNLLQDSNWARSSRDKLHNTRSYRLTCRQYKGSSQSGRVVLLRPLRKTPATCQQLRLGPLLSEECSRLTQFKIKHVYCQYNNKPNCRATCKSPRAVLPSPRAKFGAECCQKTAQTSRLQQRRAPTYPYPNACLTHLNTNTH